MQENHRPHLTRDAAKTLYCLGCKVRFQLHTVHSCPFCGNKLVSSEHAPEELVQGADINALSLDNLEPWLRHLLEELKSREGKLNGYHVHQLLSLTPDMAVCRATQLSLNRTVAIKFLSPRFTESSIFRRRFEVEGARLTRLRHPNIVNVIDRGHLEQCYFVVTEHVDGRTLEEVIASGPVAISVITHLLAELRNALTYLHGQEVIHGNITTTSILLDYEGKVKVTDFGISELLLEEEKESTRHLREPKGEPSRFQAPERSTGVGRATVESDIYSLGVTLYELLTSHTFDHDSFRPPSRHLDLFGREVDAIIERAVAEDPQTRYRDVAELLNDMLLALRRLPVKEWRSKRLSPLVTLVPLAVVALVIIAVVARRSLPWRAAIPSPTHTAVIKTPPPISSAVIKTPPPISSVVANTPIPPSSQDEETALVTPEEMTIADHILISELRVVTPELVELYNPTGHAIDLSDYYLTDSTFQNRDYYLLPSGRVRTNLRQYYDWLVKFPDGATLPAGECLVIAIQGSQEFQQQFGTTPDFELVEDDPQPDTIPEMVAVFPDSVDPDPTHNTMSNNGESLILFYWDGTSSLVKDVDYVVWGDKAEAVCKSGIKPDYSNADTSLPSYLPDTPIDQQRVISTDNHRAENSWQRLYAVEFGERLKDGNGITGNDETSEYLNQSFIERPPNPGICQLSSAER